VRHAQLVRGSVAELKHDEAVVPVGAVGDHEHVDVRLRAWTLAARPRSVQPDRAQAAAEMVAHELDEALDHATLIFAQRCLGERRHES
jgi:hypothetical protein